jgi:hypothetical protein
MVEAHNAIFAITLIDRGATSGSLIIWNVAGTFFENEVWDGVHWLKNTDIMAKYIITIDHGYRYYGCTTSTDMTALKVPIKNE